MPLTIAVSQVPTPHARSLQDDSFTICDNGVGIFGIILIRMLENHSGGESYPMPNVSS